MIVAEVHLDKGVGGETDRQTDRHRDRQTDRQTEFELENFNTQG